MSSLPSLESIYGSLTADITANTAKLERLGNQTDAVEDEEEDSAEKSEGPFNSNAYFLIFCSPSPSQFNEGCLEFYVHCSLRILTFFQKYPKCWLTLRRLRKRRRMW